MINRIIDAADEYAYDSSSKNQNKWIPVSERQPSEDGQYLVTIRVNEHVYVDCLDYAVNLSKVDELNFRNQNHGGWYDYESECGFFEAKNVTAWYKCKLPEPYINMQSAVELKQRINELEKLAVV